MTGKIDYRRQHVASASTFLAVLLGFLLCSLSGYGLSTPPTTQYTGDSARPEGCLEMGDSREPNGTTRKTVFESNSCLLYACGVWRVVR